MTDRLPRIAYLLGAAGLLPQAAAVGWLMTGSLDWQTTAAVAAFAYPALILSFLGGTWWGLAAAAGEQAPAGTWVIAVTPSLIALFTVGLGFWASWPWPMLVLGIALLVSPAIDVLLVRRGLAPPGWASLRLPLSLGLGALTIAAAAITG